MLDVLIQGAGIGGLTLGLFLVKQGLKVKILERSSELSEVGSGIWLAPNAIQVFRILEIDKDLLQECWSISRVIIEDYTGGRVFTAALSDLAREFGTTTHVLYRQKLQRFLFEKLPPNTVAFNTEIKQASEDHNRISYSLTSGDHGECQLLVGADGINSALRPMVSERLKKRYSGYTSCRGIAQNPAVPWDDDHDNREIWGQGCRLGFSKINRNDVYWYFTWLTSESNSQTIHHTKDHQYEILNGYFQKYFPRYQSILACTPRDHLVRTDISDLTPAREWTKGRIGLIGDAAHATTPNLGQGGSLAIVDAYYLSEAIKTYGLHPDALTSFQNRAFRKTKLVNQISRAFGNVCHLKHPLLRWLSLRYVRLTPAFIHDAMWRWIYKI
jgi:2-polyprenyl-6-methoxyphenol hydroxylase-like FAD-dependent oxidoreductase